MVGNTPDAARPPVTRTPASVNPLTTSRPPTPAAPKANTPALSKWVEMDQWSASEGLSLLPKTSSGRKYYQLHSAQGDLIFMDGNQTAYWNGRALMLSYAPQTTKNRPYLYRGDLQHTVVPLLSKCACGSHEGKILVIDPGHGGSDPGSRTVVGNRAEKDLTLDWALRVRALLTNQGWRVYLTRTNDASVSLTNRVAMADSLHADLFVSLHFNSLSNPNFSGLETFCMTPAGMPSNLVRGSETDAALPNNAFDDENLCWAMRLHESLVREAHVTDGGVRRARFPAVLRHQNCAAVLIEGGYLSNRQEAAKLNTEAYRQQLAEGVVKALTKNE